MGIQFKRAKFKYVAIFLVGIYALSFSTITLAKWPFVELPELGYANGINELGQVIGVSDYSFMTGPNGVGIIKLGTLDSLLPSTPADINNSGQVVGSSYYHDAFTQHAFITGPNGANMADLGTLGGNQSFAWGINDSGQVVGFADTAIIGESHAFITGPDGIGMTDLGTLGGKVSEANGINNSGQVTGNAQTANGDYHAFITGPGGVGMTDLGTLGADVSLAADINNSGQVVGNIQSVNGDIFHAFMTGPNGIGMTDLGTLGGDYSYAVAINDFGVVVGMSTTADGGSMHPFIYHNGSMTDLTLLVPVVESGWTVLTVADINNNGQIVGHGRESNHHPFQPFLLLPIPEPETYTMLLAGLGLLGFVVHRRKQMRCS